jgi:U6 snRNA phosphodiesterase
LLLSPLSVPLPLHVSLSRSLSLLTHQRESFLATLSSRLRNATVGAFSVRFSRLKCVPNFERNRWFLVLGLERPHGDELNRLLATINENAEVYGFGRLYDRDEFINEEEARHQRNTSENQNSSDRSDRFHISLAWSLDNPGVTSSWNPAQDVEVATMMKDEMERMEVQFDTVKVKIGNTVHSIALTAKINERTSSLLK